MYIASEDEETLIYLELDGNEENGGGLLLKMIGKVQKERKGDE